MPIQRFATRDLLRTWSAEGFELDLFDTGSVNQDGKSRLAYTLKDNGETIFAGDDFHASPLHAIDSDATIAALLGFLSLQAGDTDSEYFAGYTPRQLAWRDERAEDLSLLAYELENGAL